MAYEHFRNTPEPTADKREPLPLEPEPGRRLEREPVLSRTQRAPQHREEVSSDGDFRSPSEGTPTEAPRSRRLAIQVQELMTRDVEVTSPDSTVQEAAAKMHSLDIGLLPVCNGDRMLGVLTDRDITIRATAEGLDPRRVKVRDVMTPGTTYCFVDQDVREAAALMQQKQVRRLLVLDRGKRLVGILSLGDLALKSGDEQLSGQTLQHVSAPTDYALL